MLYCIVSVTPLFLIHDYDAAHHSCHDRATHSTANAPHLISFLSTILYSFKMLLNSVSVTRLDSTVRTELSEERSRM